MALLNAGDVPLAEGRRQPLEMALPRCSEEQIL
jgi:hypothetical protein